MKSKTLWIGVGITVAGYLCYLFLSGEKKKVFVSLHDDLRSLDSVKGLDLTSKEYWTRDVEELIRGEKVDLNTLKLNLACNCLIDLPENICEFKEVRELDLSNNRFDVLPVCLKTIPKLERLRIGGNEFDKDGLGVLKEIPRLVSLELMWIRLFSEHIPSLTCLRGLKELKLYLDKYSRITKDDMKKISKMDNLTHLEMRWVFDDESIENISNMMNLRHLTLLGGKGINSRDLSSLESEGINSRDQTLLGCKRINSRNLSSLESEGITEKGIGCLLNLPNLVSLEILISGVKAIEKLAGLKKLENLNISSTVKDREEELLSAIESLLEIKTLKKLDIKYICLKEGEISYLKGIARKRGIELVTSIGIDWMRS